MFPNAIFVSPSFPYHKTMNRDLHKHFSYSWFWGELFYLFGHMYKKNSFITSPKLLLRKLWIDLNLDYYLWMLSQKCLLGIMIIIKIFHYSYVKKNQPFIGAAHYTLESWFNMSDKKALIDIAWWCFSTKFNHFENLYSEKYMKIRQSID